MDLGYKKEEVIFILTKTPQLFGYNINSIKEKIEYLKSINLDYLILENPNILILSKETLEKRYIFLKSINQFEVKALYLKNKIFDKKYKK